MPINKRSAPLAGNGRALCRLGISIPSAWNRCRLKNKCTNKVQKMIEKLLPEQQLGYALLLIVIPSAQLAQNPMLCARASSP